MDVLKLEKVINKDDGSEIMLIDRPSLELSHEAMLGRDKLIYRDTFARSGNFLNRVGCAFGPQWLLGRGPKDAASTLGGRTLARDFGISPSLAKTWRILKPMWQRW